MITKNLPVYCQVFYFLFISQNMKEEVLEHSCWVYTCHYYGFERQFFNYFKTSKDIYLWINM